MRLIPIWSPADFTETATAAQEHDRKWADLPRIRGKALPSPDGCPSQVADEATARIVADLWWLADASRRVLEAAAGGARVTVVDAFPERGVDPWPHDRAADMLTAWNEEEYR